MILQVVVARLLLQLLPFGTKTVTVGGGGREKNRDIAAVITKKICIEKAISSRCIFPRGEFNDYFKPISDDFYEFQLSSRLDEIMGNPRYMYKSVFASRETGLFETGNFLQGISAVRTNRIPRISWLWPSPPPFEGPLYLRPFPRGTRGYGRARNSHRMKPFRIVSSSDVNRTSSRR